jgi:peptidoglycan/xylan/chitin deacetylase (PgdA/CDA1 family)
MKQRVAIGAAVALALLAALSYEGYRIAENPSSQLFGKTLVSGPKDERIVALTYDDGPNPPYTDEILAVLRAEHVRATFFVVGRAVQAYPFVVRHEVEGGNAIGNHTWSHGHLVLYGEDGLRRTLERTDQAIYAAAGVHTRIMRPPFGSRDWLVLGEVRKLGYTPVMWSVPLANDWEYPPARLIAARVLRYVGDGAIIDLHDGNRGIVCARVRGTPQRLCDRSADVGATRMIVEALKREGYRFVTIPELLRLSAAKRGRLRVEPAAHANEPAAMKVRRVVMGPVDDRQAAGIVHHLSADLDAIADSHRTARSDADVVDDLDGAGRAAHVEGLVHGVRPRSIEEARRRGDGSREVDPFRLAAGVRGGEIHRSLNHARARAKQAATIA